MPAVHFQREPTLAERLGFRPDDRILMIHADDVGMCHSVNMATIKAMEQGVVSSASIMVPCPWFPEIAQYCREHPEKDFGLHLTLTSEWRHYRWKSTTPPDRVPSLHDSEGFLHRDDATVAKVGKPAEVAKELRAQIERAKAFGIAPTHVDSHMGTLFYAPFYETYARVAKEAGLMPMLLKPTEERVRQAKVAFGFDVLPSHARLRRQGYVFLDRLKEGAAGDTLEARREHYWNEIRRLKPGEVTEFIVHLSLDDDEIQHVTGSWRNRYHEYLIMTDPRTRDVIESTGVKLIGYRALAKLAYTV